MTIRRREFTSNNFIRLLVIGVLAGISDQALAAPDPNFQPDWKARQERAIQETAQAVESSEAEVTFWRSFKDRVTQGFFPLAARRVEAPNETWHYIYLITSDGVRILSSTNAPFNPEDKSNAVSKMMANPFRDDINAQDRDLWLTTLANLSPDETRRLLSSDHPVPLIHLGLDLTASNRPKGVAIAHVQPKSPAATLSLQPSDIITTIDKFPVTTPQAFWDRLISYQVGSTVVFSIFRISLSSTTSMTVRYTIVEHPLQTRMATYVDRLDQEILRARSQTNKQQEKLASLKPLSIEGFAYKHRPQFNRASTGTAMNFHHHGDDPDPHPLDSFKKNSFSDFTVLSLYNTQSINIIESSRSATLLTLERQINETKPGEVGDQQLEAMKEGYAFLSNLTDEQFTQALDQMFKADGPVPEESVTPPQKEQVVWLGVTASTLNAQEFTAAKLTAGVRLNTIKSNSPAEKAGLKKGDLLISIERLSISTVEQIKTVIQQFAPNSKVNMLVQRDGVTRQIVVTLEAWPSPH